jgi:predicted acylesterase/phospholipase RssA
MRYDLVFEGGGARGIIFIGALYEVLAHNHTIGRMVGASAGAITAALVAAGYSPGEMEEAVGRKVGREPVMRTFLGEPPPFSRDEIQQSATRAFFRDVDLPMVPGFVERRLDDAMSTALLRFPVHRNLMAFVERGGWFSADGFMAWFTDRLNTGYVKRKPRRFGALTLAEFHAATGIDLSVVTADTSAARLRVLNHRTAPHCPIVWAVRMSMNLPFLWDDVVWQAEWGTYLGASLEGHVMADGGLLSSFPIELLVSNEPYVLSLIGPQSGDRVLGLLIDESLPVPNDPPKPMPPPGALNLAHIRVVERLTRMVDTMTSARDKMLIEAFADLVARLPAHGYGSLEFDMSESRRDLLIAGGRQAMRDYFDRPRPADVQPEGARVPLNTQAYANRVAVRLLTP